MIGRWGFAQLCAIALFCALPALAGAELAIEPGGATLEVVDATGEPDSRAGAHPDRLIQRFELTDTGGAPEHLKQLIIEFPPGLVGGPNAVPLCRRAVVNTWAGSCPAASQVGQLVTSTDTLPVYSVQPAPNEAAAFAAVTPARGQMLSGLLRADDQGLSLYQNEIENSAIAGAVTEGTMELWGVPADHQSGTSIPRRALLTTPTRCDIPPLSVIVNFRTWEQPSRWKSGSGDTGQPLVGCEELAFDPSLDFTLAEPRADAPSGARIDVIVPQDPDPDGRASAMVSDIAIAMPAGLTVSPGGTAGLSACSDASFGSGAEPLSCPPASRIGSLEMSVGALGRPMSGSIYLGEERPGDRFRLLIAASAPGSTMRFVGSLRADPQSGRLTTTMKDLPQTAFERMSLRFDGGPGALLATPLACGPAPTSATFTPYSGTADVQWSGTVSVVAPGGGACGPARFEPTFSGGSTSARAGRSTSFTTTVRRADGEQLPRRLAIALPAGLSAALGTVEACAASQAQAASCPPASRVGTAVAELGPGESPARLGGDVFLTGPHRGAPFGVAFVLEGDLGPLRLGALVVRGALRVDPFTGRVEVEMDALPTVFEGVPIRFQTIGLDLDRPGFLRNPTSCAPSEALARLRSESGALATPSSPFAVRGCIDLAFRPDFSVALHGPERELRERGKPGLSMSMRMPAKGANLRSVEVLLPRALKLDSSGPKLLCPRRRALEGECPRGSRIGTAVGRTPLLERPMRGFLYVVQPKDNGSPDFWAALSGQGLEVDLRGETALEKGRTATRFAGVPDFPLRALSLRLAGGEDGILRLRRDPCGRLFAPTELAGQNGARRTLRAPIAVAGGCGR